MWCNGWGDVRSSCRRGCPDRGAAVAHSIVLLFIPKCTTRKGGIYILKKKCLKARAFWLRMQGRHGAARCCAHLSRDFSPNPSICPPCKGNFLDGISWFPFLSHEA